MNLKRFDALTWLGLCLSLLLLAIGFAVHAETVIPKPARVVDATGTLSHAQLDTLLQKSAALDKETGAVLVTLMVSTTSGESIDSFAMRVAEAWKPGNADQRGAVLVIAKDDKRWAIKTTRNLGITFTDSRTKEVLNRMTAYLREHRGDFHGAIAIFYAQASKYVQREPEPAPPIQTEQTSWPLLIFAVAALVLLICVWVLIYWFKRVARERERQARLELMEQERQERLAARAREAAAKREAVGVGVAVASTVAAVAATNTARKLEEEARRAKTAEYVRKVEERRREADRQAQIDRDRRRSDDFAIFAAAVSPSWSSVSAADDDSKISSFGSSSGDSSFDGGGSSGSFDD